MNYEKKLKQINKKMQAIFKKHRVKSKIGEEEFWLAVEKVEKKSKKDANKLEKLWIQWIKTAPLGDR